MRQILWAAVLVASVALGQSQQQVVVNPDCIIPFIFTATTGNSFQYSNKQVGCNVWQGQYSNSGFATVSLTIQSAPDSGGSPGAWGTIGGTVVAGVNPMVNASGASNLINTFGTSFAPWVRMNFVGTGAGQITGVLLGFRQAGAAGSAPASTVNATITGPLGQTTMANGLSVTLPNNQTSGCTKTFVNLAASGNTQLIAASPGNNVYICDMEFSTGTPEDFKLTEGTGAACVTGTADATALMKNISAWSLTPGGGYFATKATATLGDGLCANQSGTQAAGVTIWYLQQP